MPLAQSGRDLLDVSIAGGSVTVKGPKGTLAMTLSSLASGHLLDAGFTPRELVLGEGSNLLFTRDWNGVVLTQSTPGIRVIEDRCTLAEHRRLS